MGSFAIEYRRNEKKQGKWENPQIIADGKITERKFNGLLCKETSSIS